MPEVRREQQSALHKSGVERIFISNRTQAHAKDIAVAFSGHFAVEVIGSWEVMNEHPADIIIGTVPAETVTESQFMNLMWQSKGGLYIDMSYKLRLTPLMKIAQAHGSWETANGTDVLLEQGLIQYQIWTGMEAPREVMQAAIEQ